MKRALFMLTATLLISGCVSAQQHRQDVSNTEDTVTVGTVQREIRKGMSGADVVAALGSPNIVSTDEQGREVWIYDKISTEHAYSNSSGGLSGLILGGAPVGVGAAGGAAGGGYSSNAGASSTSQKTLTVIIKYDTKGKVRDYAYHTSRF